MAKLDFLNKLQKGKMYNIIGRCQACEDVVLNGAIYIGMAEYNDKYIFQYNDKLYLFNYQDMEIEEVYQHITVKDLFKGLKDIDKDLPVNIVLENKNGYAESTDKSEISFMVKKDCIEIVLNNVKENF